LKKKNLKKNIEIIIKEKYLLASKKFKELKYKTNNKKYPKKGKNILKTSTLKITEKKIHLKTITKNSNHTPPFPLHRLQHYPQPQKDHHHY
jgi:hypothetical protein